jgi:pimeloyl-ACP methyl ester carboxylesterase
LARRMNLEILNNHIAPEARPISHPLLFVHGAACGAWVWQGMLDWFGNHGIEASAVSLRGHGGSEGHDRLRNFGVMDYVSDVHSVVAGMDKPPIVIGHSMGGLVVQKLLESWDAPGGILLASSPVGGMVRDGLRMVTRWPGRFALALARQDIREIYGTADSAQWLLFSRNADRSLVLDARHRLGPESWRAILDVTGRVRPRPKNVRTPLFVLGGSEDNMVSTSSNRRTAQAYGADIRFFDDCGHMMMLESSWPDVAGAIRDWAQSLPN